MSGGKSIPAGNGCEADGGKAAAFSCHSNHNNCLQISCKDVILLGSLYNLLGLSNCYRLSPLDCLDKRE